MAAGIRFVPDSKGFQELLTSAGVESEIMARAKAVAAAAGDGHDVLNTSTTRARATVMTITDQARESEATNHTLTKAINAARG